MDLELTPRSAFSIEKNRVTARTVDISTFLGTNTVASITMAIYDSDNSSVTTTFGKGVSESSGTLTFGVIGYATGTYRIVFSIILNEVTPDSTALAFSFELVMIVTDTSTSATAATAEQLENYALLELNECKMALNIALSTSTYDGILIHLINDATATIENYCQQRFASTEYTERYNGNNRKYLYLRNKPIISVSIITVDDQTISAATNYDDDDKYWIEPNLKGAKAIGALYRVDGWDEGNQNILITYIAGYTTIPYDIRRVANMLIKEWYNIYQNDEGLKSESIGRYSYTFATLSAEVKEHIYELLEAYIDKGYY